jgi:Asp-tRNA(Asn)/Glu-tRNA(Gln) amidotransferase A subunit family amidase
MTFSDELCFAPASNLVANLLAREVSSTELTAAFYELIGKVNPRLNAMMT